MEPLPPDVVVLHIGPHKTGTTALQSAFHHNRDELAKHNVRYAGRGRQSMLAALAMTGRPGRRGDTKATPRHWRDLVDEVRGARGQRVVVSSEFFADSEHDVPQRVVDGLGRDRVHVIITLRPLARILPSQWQQYVQNGQRKRYPAWLKQVLIERPFDRTMGTFWRRHNHGELVKRWAGVLEPDRLTVIVLDESNRRMLLDTFESMLDLPHGVLVPEQDASNRSLTLGEVEVIRLLNVEFLRRRWPNSLYGRIVRNGVAKKLLKRPPDPDEPIITTPRWALKRAGEIGQATVEAIDAVGVNVIGDLASLAMVPAPRPRATDATSDPAIPASAAVLAIIGTLMAGRGIEWPVNKRPAGKPAAAEAPLEAGSLDGFSSALLIRTAAGRIKRRVLIRARARIPH
ncbi:MAG TPA: hypothetical protein VHV79_01825 [Mycobacteriales bacterium]|jgi:hypothetical protein|nr:hypothetical protein [Mycobacteriales bacterium]